MSFGASNFILFWLLIFLTVFCGTAGYSLFILKKLPWQKPVFDEHCPEKPTWTGNKGLLIFSKTNGYRHASIEPATKAIIKEAAAKNWDVQISENGACFAKDYLDLFKVVIFLSTSGDILTQDQKTAFELFIKNGGGYVGIHSASDTEHNWVWYDDFLGSHFKSHTIFPRHLVKAELITDNRNHPATRHLPRRWTKVDEWYNFRENIRGRENMQVLLSINRKSYTAIWPAKSSEDDPISWTNTLGSGRMFYTAMGHNAETFIDQHSLQHIIGGIEWAGKF